MNNSPDFKNSSITVSQVAQGTEQGQGIWELKDWNKNFETLKENSFCTIKVGSDKKHSVRIFFGNANVTRPNVPDPKRPGCTKTVTYVPLWVELKMTGCNDPVIDLPVTVYLDVYQLSESLVSEKIFASGNVTFKLGAKPQAAIIDTFLEHSYVEYGGYNNNYNRGNGTSGEVIQPENLRFGINATITPINETLALKSSEKTASEAALSEHFGKMYQSDGNFADLKLETKDNMTLSAHKFIVAARSPMFHEVIKMETEKADFSGTIKVDVNAEPMVAILYWMYTGEVNDKAGPVMEQLIEAAMRFDLTELLKILDKKMISICTENNMFPLYQAAKKCGMLTAIDDIGAFIASKLSKS